MTDLIAVARGLDRNKVVDPSAPYQNSPKIDQANQLVKGTPFLFDPSSILSLTYNHSFTVNGIVYPTLAHYIAYHTADDPLRRALILKDKSPNLLGILGRISPSELLSITEEAIRERIKSDPQMKQEVLKTKNTIGYVDPYDRIFGIGLSKKDEDVEDETEWPGRNLLGRALMIVRSELGGPPANRPVLEPRPIVLPSEYVKPVIRSSPIPTENVIVEEVDPIVAKYQKKYKGEKGYKPYKELSQSDRSSLKLQAYELGIREHFAGERLYTEMIKVLEQGHYDPPVIPELVIQLKDRYKTKTGYKKYNKSFSNLRNDAEGLNLTVDDDATDQAIYEQIITELRKYD